MTSTDPSVYDYDAATAYGEQFKSPANLDYRINKPQNMPPPRPVDKDLLREYFNEYGMDVPEDELADNTHYMQAAKIAELRNRLLEKKLERKEAREERKQEKQDEYFMRPAPSVVYDKSVPYDTTKKTKKYDGDYEHGQSEPQIIKGGEEEEEIEEDLFEELSKNICEQIDSGADPEVVLQEAFDSFMTMFNELGDKYGVDIDDTPDDDYDGPLQPQNANRLCKGCRRDISYTPSHHTVCRDCY